MSACPTLCDDDCDAPCHEGHDVPIRRQHEVESCPGWLDYLHETHKESSR